MKAIRREMCFTRTFGLRLFSDRRIVKPPTIERSTLMTSPFLLYR